MFKCHFRSHERQTLRPQRIHSILDVPRTTNTLSHIKNKYYQKKNVIYEWASSIPIHHKEQKENKNWAVDKGHTLATSSDVRNVKKKLTRLMYAWRGKTEKKTHNAASCLVIVCNSHNCFKYLKSPLFPCNQEPHSCIHAIFNWKLSNFFSRFLSCNMCNCEAIFFHFHRQRRVRRRCSCWQRVCLLCSSHMDAITIEGTTKTKVNVFKVHS